MFSPKNIFFLKVGTEYFEIKSAFRKSKNPVFAHVFSFDAITQLYIQWMYSFWDISVSNYDSLSVVSWLYDLVGLLQDMFSCP